MSILWSNDLELTFLKYYQAESILWDVKHPHYKDKNKNNNAWERISELMKISVADLKRKKESLLSSYRKYRKIVRDSIYSATDATDVYKPIWFAYDIMESFLGKGLNCNKNAISNEEQDLKVEDGERPAVDKNNETPQTTKHKTTPMKLHRYRNPPKLQARTYVKKAISTLNAALKRNEPQEDECDLYGRMLAKKLRKLSENDRLEFMYEIDGMFLQRQSNHSERHVYIRMQSPVSYAGSPTPSEQS